MSWLRDLRTRQNEKLNTLTLVFTSLETHLPPPCLTATFGMHDLDHVSSMFTNARPLQMTCRNDQRLSSRPGHHGILPRFRQYLWPIVTIIV